MKKLTAIGTSFSAILLSAQVALAANDNIDLTTPGKYAGTAINANDLVRFIINGLIVVGIVLSLIFLIWGGLRWIMSGGDKAKVDTARGTIVAAIVGLIIVILAWVIINTVLFILTGAGLQNFELPTIKP